MFSAHNSVSLRVFPAVLTAAIILLTILHYAGVPPENESIVKSDPSASISAYLCPPENCTLILHKLFNSRRWDSIRCAFYDLDDPLIVEDVLRASSRSYVKLVFDGGVSDIRVLHGYASIHREHGKGLMHNKFCIFQSGNSFSLFTGSYNPALGGRKNWNIVVVSNSSILSKLYMDEFMEMWNGDFHGGSRSEVTLVRLNNSLAFVRFCPEDSCEKWLVRAINSSSESIFFTAFSLTSRNVVLALESAFERGISVSGFAEPFQAGRSSVKTLREKGLNISFLDTPGLLHTKLFIMDERLVITGSYNPTASAAKINDENLIFVDSKEVAGSLLGSWKKAYSTFTAR